MTQSRISRRGLLGGAGAVGLSAFLAACGVKGTSPQGGATPSGGGSSSPTPGAVGSASWWATQKLHHKVNFANWPYYIDVLKGKHLSLERLTKLTGITVNYTEPINDNIPFYAKIRPSLQAKQSTGYDIIVMTNNSPPLGYLIDFGWLIPLDHSMMSNFDKHAGPLIKNPSWDPGNKYTMAWQSGWTAIGYNSSVVKNPGSSVGVLFDKKYAGRVGMMNDLQELGSVALLALDIEPATSKESDWVKAARLLQRQKSDGIPRAYYDQSYIDHLKNGDIVVSQAWSGDIFQADLNSKYRDLKLLMPKEGGMFWTDNMCIPMYAQNPKDAMAVMDFFYNPQVQAVVEYYNDYVCPVPAAKQVLQHPTGWAKTALKEMKPEIGLSPSVTADAPTVFPDQQYVNLSRPYYTYKSQAELDAWNNLFLPITQGA
ncbi:MAG TPA: spermidine/putrescine ABC transporter substrate-binding protein [Nocardioidaceae bacterium]|nr:spermidine/putrescine ABC transporter substrate-binding protein [Nocardioidaceae bacterium]